MLRRLRRAWLQHVLYRSRIPYSHWHEAIKAAPVLSRLNHREQRRLRKLASLFLHDKTINGASDLEVTSTMRIYIAAHACLLVLNLNLDYFHGWNEVIVYPSAFVVKRDEVDEIGVVHETHRTLAGESWRRGPVILSWSDAMPGAHPHGSASNVILHEFAHKLDMLTGNANGLPLLHKDMSFENWTLTLSEAYKKLYHQLERHHHTAIDPYAAESPAEFFSVLTEVFFVKPALLYKHYPKVYHQFSLFYRQDTLQRFSH